MLRLIDANINRLSEGLRLLEDVARFILEDASLTSDLKSLRHELSAGQQHLELLWARDSAGDIGAFAETPQEARRADIASIVTANARRAQESLRALEEMAKLPEAMLDPSPFKRARFALYDIERTMVARLMRRGQRGRIAGLYVIVDHEALGGRGEAEVARQAIRGGASVIQLRDKRREKGEVLASARVLRDVCAQGGALFIVNDHLDVTIAARADGLHIGQGDLPVAQARRLLPVETLLGCSTTTVDQALVAEAHGADYIAVGSIYPTPSKDGAIVVGLERLRQVREVVSLPIVAIGGINEDNVAAVMEAGADAAVVIGAVLGAPDIAEGAQRLVKKMEAT